LDVCKKALEKVPVVPGRVEVVQARPFTVVVDYAYEPEEMRQLYETVARWPHNRVIQILGPTGGGRDQDRIPVLGRMAGEFADMVVVTTDDPYDDNPRTLAEKMAAGVGTDKKPGVSLFTIQDRRAAIIKAFMQAVENDLVLITGKGAEQSMVVKDEKIPWSDRKAAEELLQTMAPLSRTASSEDEVSLM
jgi:UDP-N-acetylmuramyl tripeptide synthase